MSEVRIDHSNIPLYLITIQLHAGGSVLYFIHLQITGSFTVEK